MKIVQEIGSYAGLAAIFGLAVLAALYFSQARDVKRLREWAGRAPERAPDTGGVPAAVPTSPAAAARAGTQVPGRAPVRPVPRAPGQTAVRPSPAAAAAAAAAGAAPATATGPAAATPAARAAEGARTGEEEGAASNGTEERSSLDQDTVVHPPPPLPGEESEEFDAAEDSEEGDALTGDSAEVDELVDEEFDSRESDALDDAEEFEDEPDSESAEGDALPPEAHWEDTGDQPVVPVPPRRAEPAPVASGPSTAAGAAGGGSILPPYEESRPGGAASPGDGGRFGSRGRGLAVIGVAVIVLAVVVFGVTRLLGGDDGSNTQAKAGNTTGKAAPSRTTSTPARRAPRRGAINPANVRVAVLNGTTVPGLAAQIGDEVSKQGFRLGTVTNFNDQQRAESVVLYAPGAEREAAEVGRRLKISQREPIDAESQGVAGDASVAVVTGRDKTP